MDIIEIHEKLRSLQTNDNVEKILKQETEKNNLVDAINAIETADISSTYDVRKNFDDQIKRCNDLVNDEIIHDYFGKMKGKTTEHETEELIVRHIMLSDKYNAVLGTPVFFEFPVVEGRRYSIDLITYKDNTINLIEVKRCTINHNKTSRKDNEKASEDHFLKIATQLSMYYNFFKRMFNDPSIRKEIIKAFNEVGHLSLDENANYEIHKCMLIPEDKYMSYYDERKELENNYDYYTIELNNNYDNLRDKMVSSNEELFKIASF